MPDWITANDAAKIRAEQTRRELYPLGSLSAAATRLVTTTDKNRRRTQMPERQSWQEEGWRMFDLVGELHFLTTTLANRVGSGALYVGNVNAKDPTAEPEQSDNETAQAILSAFGGTQAGQSQIIRRMALNLIVAGEGWLFGVDADQLTEAIDETGNGLNVSTLPVRLPDRGEPADPAGLEWRTLSVDEVETRPDGTIHLHLEDGTKLAAAADSVDLIRVWRPHGRKAAEPDSPVKASLPVLREIIGLTMRVAAEIDSRLAGAGMLWVRQSVLQSLRTGEEQDSLGTADDLMREMIKAMMTPIQDRASAAAVVPMVVPVPDDVADPFGKITFSTPLDENLAELREGAIRRFALGMDAPPEILMGTACASSDTEILTARGWLTHEQVAVGDLALALNHDTGLSEWQPITAVNKYEVDQDLYRFTSHTHDSLTTANHSWPVERQTCGVCHATDRRIHGKGRCRRCWKRARKLGAVEPVRPGLVRMWVRSDELDPTHDQVILGVTHPGPSEAKFTDDFVEASAWLATDGDLNRGRGRIRQSHTANPGNCARISAVLPEASQYVDPHTQTTVWTFDPEELVEAGEFVGSRFIISGDFVRLLTPAQRELMLRVGILANGHQRGNSSSMYALDPHRLDAFALAVMLCGYRVSWNDRPQGAESFGTDDLTRLSWGTQDRTRVKVSVEHYSGTVWCPTVAGAHTWLARRNGRAAYTGNSANHWGAWLVNEDTVTVHIEPPLAMICDALTTQYLWPALIRSGMSEEQAQQYVVWYSVEHMVVRPNQFDEAKYLYEIRAIDEATIRRAGGFDDSDAPGAGENKPEIGKYSEEQAEPEAVDLAFKMVGSNPALLSTPGLPKLVRDIKAVLVGDAFVEPELPNMTPAQPVDQDEEDEEQAGELPTKPTTDSPPDIGNPA